MQRNHIILGATLLAVFGALVWRSQRATDRVTSPPLGGAAATNEPASTDSAHSLPRLVELGSDSCASCRAMIPVLAELRGEHKGQLDVDFIDVWKFPDEAETYAVRVIPTQVFLAPDGTELARHQGFYAAGAIRDRWNQLGYRLEPSPEPPTEAP